MNHSFLNFCMVYIAILLFWITYFGYPSKEAEVVKPDHFAQQSSYVFKNKDLDIEFGLDKLSIIKAKINQYDEYIHCNTILSQDVFSFLSQSDTHISFISKQDGHIVSFIFEDNYLIKIEGLNNDNILMYFENHDVLSYFDYKSYYKSNSMTQWNKEVNLSWIGKNQNSHYLFAISGDLKAITEDQHINIKGDKLYLYLGLKDKKYFTRAQDKFLMIDKTIYYGVLSFFVFYLMSLVDFIYSYCNNYGLVIIILTILLRFITFFIMYKSHQSISKMNLLKTHVALIEKKFTYGSEDYNYALNKLYKREKVNPMARFWSQFFQMPIYYLLYGLFAYDLSFKNASFLYLTDLSGPDIMVLFDFSFIQLKLLPLLFGVTIIAQTLMSNSGKKLLLTLLMVLILSVFLNNWSSGLLIYMILSNILGTMTEFILGFLIK